MKALVKFNTGTAVLLEDIVGLKALKNFYLREGEESVEALELTSDYGYVYTTLMPYSAAMDLTANMNSDTKTRLDLSGYTTWFIRSPESTEEELKKYELN